MHEWIKVSGVVLARCLKLGWVWCSVKQAGFSVDARGLD